jgi:hypothetical protein
MQRLLVGAADIHAGPAPDRLQPFEDFDVASGVAAIRRARLRRTRRARAGARLGNSGEQIVRL